MFLEDSDDNEHYYRHNHDDPGRSEQAAPGLDHLRGQPVVIQSHLEVASAKLVRSRPKAE